MSKLSPSASSLVAIVEYVIVLEIFFVKSLEADTESVTKPTNSPNNVTNSDLEFPDFELQCIYLRENLDETRKKLVESQRECAGLHESFDMATYQLKLCETDLKKFAALLAVRARILFMEKIFGKDWSGAKEPYPSYWDPAETFNHHRDLWMWILDGSKDARATELKKHVRMEGLAQTKFCESMAGTIVSTSFMQNITIRRFPRFTSRAVVDSLKNSSLNDVQVKAMVLVMRDEFLTLPDDS